ncbi:hypothetical protein CHCC20375_2989 [Bacillus licheniformis]|nr:hypothetical protein CHCC20375_2989 [Bacillus licheniformis]
MSFYFYVFQLSGTPFIHILGAGPESVNERGNLYFLGK